MRRPLWKHYSYHSAHPTPIYTLSLHDALPISKPAVTATVISPRASIVCCCNVARRDRPKATGTSANPSARDRRGATNATRSEEHTSELQSRFDLVCRLLLEKKKRPHMRVIKLR